MREVPDASALLRIRGIMERHGRFFMAGDRKICSYCGHEWPCADRDDAVEANHAICNAPRAWRDTPEGKQTYRLVPDDE